MRSGENPPSGSRRGSEPANPSVAERFVELFLLGLVAGKR